MSENKWHHHQWQEKDVWIHLKIKGKKKNVISFASTQVLCFKFSALAHFCKLTQRFLQTIQPLKTPKLPTSTFDLEGTPRSSAQTSSEPFFKEKKTAWGGSMAGSLMSTYCATGPARGIKGVWAPRGLVGAKKWRNGRKREQGYPSHSCNQASADLLHWEVENTWFWALGRLKQSSSAGSDI